MLLRPDLAGRAGDSASYGPAASGSFSRAVASAGPSVVNIYTRRQVIRGGGAETRRRSIPPAPLRTMPPAIRYENSLGSGVIVSPDGYVLTNNHVVDKALEIAVLLADGRYAAAEVLGSDPDTDLALLRIGLDELKAIKLGRSEAVQVGDVVLAIGNPLGLGQTVTQGIVSATGRSRLGLSTFEDFIQTDALINDGNSGGALINARGELIGINTAVLSQRMRTQSTGIGFAIPVSMARGVMAQLIEHGHVIRGWLGVSSLEVTPELAEAAGLRSARGLWIEEVYAGTPAEDAGLRRGDVLTHVNGREIFYVQEALNLIAGMPPGDIVELAGSRGGREFSARVKISERPSPGS
ncbi:MAG: trypsin-like serine protease [Gammaproteobacteria bacterium]|nr:trypsin-like serine protease [Gammaproteobacteria bacterium]